MVQAQMLRAPVLTAALTPGEAGRNARIRHRPRSRRPRHDNRNARTRHRPRSRRPRHDNRKGPVWGSPQDRPALASPLHRPLHRRPPANHPLPRRPPANRPPNHPDRPLLPSRPHRRRWYSTGCQ
jgi:hypothetical protein